MKYKLSAVLMILGLIAAGTAFAGDVGLTSVLYPEGKKVDVPIAGTQRAPAAELSLQVRHQSGQSSIEIQYKNLPPAVLFGGDIVSYVVWAISPDGTVENIGGIANDEATGVATYSTAKRDFALMITAEPIVMVRTPGELVVFFSGTPMRKDVQPTGFTFGGLSDRQGHIKSERDTIAGMSYKAYKKNPLALIQARKAVELMDRFEAKKFDASTYDEAMAVFAEALKAKGQKQLDASKRTITLAGQALSKTVQMIEAAKAAEAEAAKKALAGQASDLGAQLAAVTATLQETQRKLAGTESELAQARATNSKLTKQQEAITERLTKALGKMASGAKTNRGYVVSLSGVAFATGESALNTEGKYVLAKLSGVMLAFEDMKLSIERHTDSTGSDEANRKLSLARADSVKAFLTEMGDPAAVMTTQGFGPDKPLMPNDTPEGRAKNRRVEIVLIETR
jgi:outer membrane protein OmpA-like peptidoglycan-associated protein